MRVRNVLKVGLFVSLAIAGPLLASAVVRARSPAEEANPTVGAQYSTTHVYVAATDVDPFVASFLGTFGGSSTKQVIVTVTPTPSSTSSQLLLTPVGSLSVFGFRTPIPYPFGQERTGYLVHDLDAAVQQARADGAGILVAPFADPIGRDALIQWPGGVNMQLYWHTTAPSYPALGTAPENASTSRRRRSMSLSRTSPDFHMARWCRMMFTRPGSRSVDPQRVIAASTLRPALAGWWCW